ncbi:predicted protein [Sclerotinia sclerotiorum 1980 UF-70]|uniref:Uncharacterized protein n=1 Tax=Sclerotinia sclerotiorum (strain ATCC 18683 / 1980 / Ss-1) TaxID=665079 RepID=A7ECK5_SCLS1|nr:predicted protein [Sclerotinia sclerotiorum 1980 UF-70]EDO00184.1 predicted protein [Sclerotinia sclerotiorum 1980 UF-70]
MAVSDGESMRSGYQGRCSPTILSPWSTSLWGLSSFRDPRIPVPSLNMSSQTSDESVPHILNESQIY